MRDESDDGTNVCTSGKVDASDARHAARRTKQTGEYAKQRGLPSPVGTEQCEALAIVHGKREIADGHAAAEGTGEPACLNRHTRFRTQ
jgi:hypothetical protein